MIANHLKIAFRYLWQNRLYTTINIAGLGIGIACVFLALLYIRDERDYDGFHQQSPYLYRITTTLAENSAAELRTVAGTGQVQGPAFKAAIPEIKDFVRIHGGDIYGDVLAGGKALSLQLLFTDDRFFEVFSFPFLTGDKQSALKDINGVVITESTARKFFNRTSVVGQVLEMVADPSASRLGKPMIITGVIKDPPANSSIQFDILLNMRFMQLSFTDDNWLSPYLGTFVVLDPHADPAKVVQKFNQVHAQHAAQQLADNKKRYGYDPHISYGLQDIRDIHLHPLYVGNGNREAGVINGSTPVSSFIFGGIAFFILLMACFNFINISIASALKRAREVGVRKVNGGSRYQIIIQFLVESSVVVVLAFLCAMIIVLFALPLFNKLSGKSLLFTDMISVYLVPFFFLLLFTVILFTTVYPAYILSGFNPAKVLYGHQPLSSRYRSHRVLVVFQFTLSIFLIIATLLFYQQMEYIRTKDLGYNPRQVIRTHIPGNRDIKAAKELISNELAAEPSLLSLSFGGTRSPEPVKVNNREISAMHQVADENFLQTMEISLKAGRNFSSLFPADKTSGAIVNEAFVKAAGIESPIGTMVHTSDYFNKEVRTIIGVVKDYHAGPLREKIEPMVMIMNDWYDGAVWMRYRPGQQARAVAALEKAFNKTLPGAVFKYDYLDALNAKAYSEEQHWKEVTGLAALLSVFICCLGLFGLTHLAIHRRIKEIGVRKVMGASVGGITLLLSRDFLKLVIYAFMIASPLAWWAMQQWLQQFAYHIEISGWLFVLAGMLAILIALISVAGQAIRAAIANPLKSLRVE